MQNEIYFSLASYAVLPASRVIQHCIVSGELLTGESTLARSSSPSKRHRTVSKVDSLDRDTASFVCHLAVDSKRGLFFKFDWETHRIDAVKEPSEEGGRAWDVVVDDNPPKTPRKAKKRKLTPEIDDSDDQSGGEGEGASYQDSGETSADSDDDLPSLPSLTASSRTSSPLFSDNGKEPPKTPRKRQKKQTMSTPRKSPTKTTTPRLPKRTLAAPTPHSKAALRARAQKRKSNKKIKSLPMPFPGDAYKQHLQHPELPDDPWLRAMHVLHVAARPDALPCREEEYGRVLRAVEELLEEGSGGCVCASSSFYLSPV